jgi:phosphatidate cytidylyltransferase
MTDSQTIRHRAAGDAAAAASTRKNESKVVSSSDDEELPSEEKLEKLTKILPQATDKLGKFVDDYLSALPERWRNWVVRGLVTVFMIALFGFLVNRGALWLMALVYNFISMQFNSLYFFIGVTYSIEML